MSLEFALTHCLCHVTASIHNHARKWKLLVFSNALKLICFKCFNLRTEADMKSPLTLFDVAMSKL